MIEILLVIFVLLWATMLFAKYLTVEIWAVTHGQESPRLARKAARKELARQWGRPTVGQAIEDRVVRRIENPPERRWLAQFRELVREVAADSIAEARIRHHVNSRKRAARYADARFRTGGTATAPPPPRREPPPQGVPETWACPVCPDGLAAHPGGLCRDCEDENASAAAADPGPEPHEVGPDAGPVAGLRVCHHLDPGTGGAPCGETATVHVAATRPDSAVIASMLACPRHVDDARSVSGYAGEHPVGKWCTRAGATWDEPNARCALIDEEEQHDPADDAPEPPDHDDTTEHHDGKDSLMGTTTHRINVDVNDPCTALQYAQNSRGLVDAIVGQLVILATNLKNGDVGPAPINEVNVMADVCRTFVASLGESVAEYAQHVVIQAELHAEPDLRDTVKDTYLAGDGAAVTAAPPPEVHADISAVDVHTPEGGKRFMQDLRPGFAFLQKSSDHIKGAHDVQGLKYDPVDLLAAQLELATQLAGQADRSADTFARHISKRADTIGKKEGVLGGTQGPDKYLTGAVR